MKVGDIVRQNNNLVTIRKAGKMQPSAPLIGVVVEIRNQHPPKDVESEWLKGWMDRLGRHVDVLWSNGKLVKNFAEHSLEIIEEKK